LFVKVQGEFALPGKSPSSVKMEHLDLPNSAVWLSGSEIIESSDDDGTENVELFT